MFRRAQHQSVLTVLGALRSDLLSACHFLFGGGTRIVLELDEYRESLDIDFVCSDSAGYAELRLASTRQGHAGLFSPDSLGKLDFPREIRVDQYGIRLLVVDGETRMRLELIREARMELSPGVRPSWSPVDCLSLEDCFAEKLLANSDRWADGQVLSRDLIDLAALRARFGPIPNAAWEKAQLAYKSSPKDDLAKALSAFEDKGKQSRCFESLRVDPVEPIREGLSLLRTDLNLDA